MVCMGGGGGGYMIHTRTYKDIYRRSNGRLKRLLTGRPGGSVINIESAYNKEHIFAMHVFFSFLKYVDDHFLFLFAYGY